MIDDAELLRHLSTHAGLDDAAARRAVEATLAALGEILAADEAARLGRSLPPAWATKLSSSPLASAEGRSWDRERFVERVAAHAAVGPTNALDEATAACAALSALLDEETRSSVARALGAGGALFEIVAEGRPPRRSHASEPPARATLAEGRAGSRHPVSEAAPHGAQSGSVAEANPHGDAKLSSARGLTQEALGDTLAEGKPGPRRTLGES